MLDEQGDIGILHAIDGLAGSFEAGAPHEGKGGSAVGNARYGRELDPAAGGGARSGSAANVSQTGQHGHRHGGTCGPGIAEELAAIDH